MNHTIEHTQTLECLIAQLDEGDLVNVENSTANALLDFMLDEGIEVDDYRMSKEGNGVVSLWKA